MVDKSIIDQIHIIKQVAEKSHELNKDVHMLLVDFKAAYHSVDRNKTVERNVPFRDTRKTNG
jgi:hypothetical protein